MLDFACVCLWFQLPGLSQPCLCVRLCLQVLYRVMLHCPTDVLRDLSVGDVPKRRAPVSRFTLFRWSDVVYSRAARVRAVTSVPMRVRIEQSTEIIVQQPK